MSVEVKKSPLELSPYRTIDLAVLLNCTEQHIRNQVAKNKIPGVIRLGRMVRFNREVIDRWLVELQSGKPASK